MTYKYDYPRMMLTVDSVIFLQLKDEVRVLLIQRLNEPFKGEWALPGGFVDMDETLEEAAARELEEETGLSGLKLMQLKAFSALERDPRGRCVSVVFVGFATKESIDLSPKDDAADARWFPIKELPEMAFDHSEIVQIAVNELVKALANSGQKK